jgi:hypothetical protein
VLLKILTAASIFSSVLRGTFKVSAGSRPNLYIYCLNISVIWE